MSLQIITPENSKNKKGAVKCISIIIKNDQELERIQLFDAQFVMKI